MSDESASSIQKVDSYDSIVACQRNATDFFNSIDPSETFAWTLSCNRRSLNSLAIADLFDHLVGATKQRPRHGEPERLRSLHVDHQFELGGLLDR